MDYKYIEQLLERYWNCETSLEEEQILRSFFRQKEVPAHLLRYKQLFAYQDVEKEKGLGDDFDTRILTRIESQPLRRSSSPLRCPSVASRFPQCAYYQAHLGRRVRARTGRKPQGGQAGTQTGIKINPMFQLTVSSLRTKIGAIELGKFSTPIGTDFKRVHI